MTQVVTVRAPAKINLSLQILGVRSDGYHELRTVFQSIALADTLVFRTRKGPFRLTCDHPDVLSDDRNLVWRAAERLGAAVQRPGDHAGVSVTIRKRIPLQAGLGGGSADAAAALAGLTRLWNARLPAAAIQGLAAGLGADVPFFLIGGTALGLGRGDEIHPQPDQPRRWVVLACPPFGVPTAEAYRWYDEDEGASGGASGSAATAPQRLTVRPELVEGRTNPAGVCGHGPGSPVGGSGFALREPQRERGEGIQVANDLERCVARRHPVIGEAIERLREAGAATAAMSGSGSAVFGLFAESAGARRAAGRVARAGWTILVTRTLTRAETAARLGRGGADSGR